MAEIKSTSKYLIKRKYKTIDGVAYPMDEYQVILVTENSVDCGYIAPQYQMSATTGYLCDYETYTKYERLIRMVSYDSGVTWSVAEPLYEERGEPIAYNSYDCGKLMERWIETDDYVCVAGMNYFSVYAIDDDVKITFNKIGQGYLYYSLDYGETWTEYTTSFSIQEGTRAVFKGNLRPAFNSGSIKGTGTFRFSGGNVNIEGNILSLQYLEDYQDKTSLISGTNIGVYDFYKMFKNNPTIINAENLELPAMTLKTECYEEMFADCVNLKTTPKILPSTTLAKECYIAMFSGCTSIEVAPELPALDIRENGCYTAMFYECNNLKYIKCLAKIVPNASQGYYFGNSWAYRVAEDGVFIINPEVPNIARDASGIPVGWKIRTTDTIE